ncbi:hypothetical protein CJ430_31900, partial [Klebsiella pneumoniae]
GELTPSTASGCANDARLPLRLARLSRYAFWTAQASGELTPSTASGCANDARLPLRLARLSRYAFWTA